MKKYTEVIEVIKVIQRYSKEKSVNERLNNRQEFLDVLNSSSIEVLHETVLELQKSKYSYIYPQIRQEVFDIYNRRISQQAA
jgi:hypothetical protein